MKRLLFFALFIFLASPAWADDYFACAAGDITSNTVWCTAAHATGSCANDGTFVASATVLAGTHNLYMNGCAMTAAANFTAAKISTVASGSEAAGGGLTVSTNGVVVQANIESGTTPALTITGAGVEVTVGSVGTPVSIQGGSAASANGVTDTHTTAGKNTTVYATTITGGTNASARGYSFTGATGNVNITATSATGATAYGVYTGSAGTMTFNGDCIGSDSTTGVSGCLGALGIITVTGSIKAGTKENGANGYIYWAPSATTKYLQMKTTGAANIEARSPAATDVRSGTTYGTATGSMSAGGGGAWGF